MAETFRSDGKAVEVTLQAVTEKGTPVYLDGFAGITLSSGSSGDTVAIEVAQREHEITVGSGVAAAKGAVLYIHADGTVDDQSASGVAFMKVTVAKDVNNVVWGILLPQGAKL